MACCLRRERPAPHAQAYSLDTLSIRTPGGIAFPDSMLCSASHWAVIRSLCAPFATCSALGPTGFLLRCA